MEESEILDASLLIEKELGLTTVFGIIEYPPAIDHCEVLFPTDDELLKAIDIASKLREAGKAIGAIDIIVASMCINRNAKLVTKDGDFKHIKSIEPEFRLEIR